MAYQQQGRLLVPIKTQVIPIGDLGLPIGGVEGLQYPNDLPPVLAINGIQTTAGPRIVHGNPAGSLYARPTTQTTLLTPQALTASINIPLPDMSWVSVCSVLVNITAFSGTTPSMQASIQSSPDNGTTWAALCFPAAMTTALNALMTVGVGANTSNTTGISRISNYSGPIPPLCRVTLTISGTTPSFTTGVYLVSQ